MRRQKDFRQVSRQAVKGTRALILSYHWGGAYLLLSRQIPMITQRLFTNAIE